MNETPNDILRLAKEALAKAIDQKKQTEKFMDSIGPAIVDILKPLLNKIADNSKIAKDDLLDAVSNIKITVPNEREQTVKVNVPDIKIPEIRVPQPKVTVNVPKINIPDIRMPEEMDIRGWIGIMGYDKGLLNNPIPVQLRDANGNPVTFGQSTQALGGMWGQAAGGSSGSSSGGLTNTELRATSLEITQTSGANFSVVVTGSTGTTATVGDSASRSADNGSAPVKVGGIARRTNPTMYADGDRAEISLDDVGRQVMRTVQIRDLMATAYATIANGTETTLKSGVAGAFLDLVYIMGSNNSDVAVSVDIRSVTGGNIIMTLQIPASSVAGLSLPVPIPQDNQGNNWTVDMGDITGTTVSLSALFSQEV
jgi:hypothetical protein